MHRCHGPHLTAIKAWTTPNHNLIDSPLPPNFNLHISGTVGGALWGPVALYELENPAKHHLALLFIHRPPSTPARTSFHHPARMSCSRNSSTQGGEVRSLSSVVHPRRSTKSGCPVVKGNPASSPSSRRKKIRARNIGMLSAP